MSPFIGAILTDAVGSTAFPEELMLFAVSLVALMALPMLVLNLIDAIVRARTDPEVGRSPSGWPWPACAAAA